MEFFRAASGTGGPRDFPRGIPRRSFCGKACHLCGNACIIKRKKKNRKVLRRQRTDDPVAECRGLIDPRKTVWTRAGAFCSKTGRSRAVGEVGAPLPARRLSDCTGLCAAPGLVGHCTSHLRDPGQTQKEGRVLGAAARRRRPGRRDDAICACRTQTPRARHARNESGAVREKGEGGDPPTSAWPALWTVGAQKGRPRTDLAALKGGGAPAAFSRRRPPRFEQPLNGGGFVRGPPGFSVAGRFPTCEDLSLSAGGKINEGEVSRSLGVPGRARAAAEGLRHGRGDLAPCRGVPGAPSTSATSARARVSP